MSHMSEDDTRCTPAQTILELKELISIATTCADFKRSTLRHFNPELLKKIGFSEINSEMLQKYFCKFHELPGNLPEPLALAYHGHQFGQYNPDLGDGRGFLYAQFHDSDGRLLDLGTKGSGQTAFSRSGDGRLTLKGGVREALATEMLEALGVNTSKTLTLFETHEELHRGDEPSPAKSSVMVRMSHSHIRFGTFQRLAYMENKEGLQQLIEYSVRHYYPEVGGDTFSQTVQNFFHAVMVATADMIASWMAAGFVHGVMNTDNMVITGESFDYGPYRFLPKSDPNFVAAYFDQGGRYRFGRQPEVGLWNLTQLAGCFLGFCTVSELEAVLDNYAETYKSAFRKHLFRRLGLAPTKDNNKDDEFVQTFLTWLTQAEAGFEQSFFDLFCGMASELRLENSPQSSVYKDQAFAPTKRLLFDFEPVAAERLNSPYFEGCEPVTLLLDDIEDIWAQIDEHDDWTKFREHIEWMRRHREAAQLRRE